MEEKIIAEKKRFIHLSMMSSDRPHPTLPHPPNLLLVTNKRD
jgi:hypothetical protein